MNNWKQIIIDKKQIYFKLEKSYKIKFPDNSNLKGVGFFMPASLVKEVGKDKIAISYPDDFIFVCDTIGQGSCQPRINVKTFEEAFNE